MKEQMAGLAQHRTDQEKEIDKLKEITLYQGCTENSPIIKRFWRVMTAYDDDQRQAYLKFVWGRSRLPIDVKSL